MARRVQRPHLEAADVELVAGLEVAGGAVDQLALGGWISTCASGQRFVIAASSATWSWWWWVSSTWVIVDPVRLGLVEQRPHRAAGVDEEACAAGPAATR